jgi:hypothetical protein
MPIYPNFSAIPVLRWMRADNLLCLRRRKFILTTDSKHGMPIYPNFSASPRLGKRSTPGRCTWTISFLTAYSTNSAID